MNCVVLYCAYLFRNKGGMFANCRAITDATLHYMFVLCIQNHLLHLRLPSYNRHVSCATKFILKRSVGLETSAVCLVSGNHCPCALGVWCFSRLVLYHSPSSSSWPSPSCGTCGGGKSLICCRVVKAERQKGHLSLGIGGCSLAILLGVALEEPP